MKHFANYIDVYLLSKVQSINGTTVVTTDGSEPYRFNAFSNVQLNETPNEENGNVFYVQETRIPLTKKLTEEQRSVFLPRRPVVVKLYDDTASPIVFGDAGYKARLVFETHLENDVLNIVRESPEPLL